MGNEAVLDILGGEQPMTCAEHFNRLCEERALVYGEVTKLFPPSTYEGVMAYEEPLHQNPNNEGIEERPVIPAVPNREYDVAMAPVGEEPSPVQYPTSPVQSPEAEPDANIMEEVGSGQESEESLEEDSVRDVEVLEPEPERINVTHNEDPVPEASRISELHDGQDNRNDVVESGN